MRYFPREIVMGLHMEFKKHCKAVFGSYVEAHENLTVTNNMNPMIHEFITLRTNRNIHGTQKVFCL